MTWRYVVRGQAMVERAKVYSGENLITRHEARVASQAAEAAAEAAAVTDREEAKKVSTTQKQEEVARPALLECQLSKQRTHRG